MYAFVTGRSYIYIDCESVFLLEYLSPFPVLLSKFSFCYKLNESDIDVIALKNRIIK